MNRSIKSNSSKSSIGNYSEINSTTVSPIKNSTCDNVKNDRVQLQGFHPQKLKFTRNR